jgi:predicted RNase H-like HicB family nuclease
LLVVGCWLLVVGYLYDGQNFAYPTNGMIGNKQQTTNNQRILTQQQPTKSNYIQIRCVLIEETMKNIKIIVEKHPDGYVAYPLGIKGVVVGQGDTYQEALNDVRSAILFHVETFGESVS